MVVERAARDAGRLDEVLDHRGVGATFGDHAECRFDDALSSPGTPFTADAGAMVDRLARGRLAYLGHRFGESK